MRYTFTVLVATLAVGCATRPLYQPVSFAQPSPFTKPGCKLAVEDVHTDHLTVEGKPEAEWLAGKTPEQQASYQEDKRAGQAMFSKEMQKKRAGIIAAAANGDNVFLVRPMFADFDPKTWGQGFGTAHMSFDVLDSAGKLIDQFVAPFTLGGFSSGDRMRAAYVTAAWAVDQYVHDRWACAAK